jgi:hypothetical protein
MSVGESNGGEWRSGVEEIHWAGFERWRLSQLIWVRETGKVLLVGRDLQGKGIPKVLYLGPGW